MAMVTTFSLAGLGTLYAGGVRLRTEFRLADLVTALRSITVCVILLRLFTFADSGRSLSAAQQWLIVVALALSGLSDFFDGYLARRHGSTDFGAIWDMENDVVFTFALAFLVHSRFGIGSWIMTIGVFRYIYFLLFRFPGDPARCPVGYKRFAKWVCAILVVVLITLTVPVIPIRIKIVMAIAALVLQIASFGWDMVLHLSVSPHKDPSAGAA